MTNTRLNSCILALVMILAASVNAMAEGFTLKNFTFLKPGEKATIALNLKNEKTIKTMETKIVLPEGLSFVTKEGSEDNYVVNTTERTKNYVVSLSKDGVYENGAYLLSYTFKKDLAVGEGAVFTFDVNVDANFSGTKEIKLVSTDICTSDKELINDGYTAQVISSDNQVFVSGNVAPLTVGQEQTVNFSIDFEKTIFRIVDFEIVLPKGLTLVSDSEQVGAICNNHQAAISKDNYMHIFVLDPMESDNFSANSGELCSFNVVADETFENSEILIKNIECVAKYEGENVVFHAEDFAIEVTKDTSTGINGIDAAAEGADGIYQINGVRTDKMQRGVNVVVKNGKAIKVVKK